MPDWKTHIVFGLLVAIGWAAVFPLVGIPSSAEKLFSVAFVAAFASLFPDIDVKSSKMRWAVALLLAASVAGAYALLFPQMWFYALAYFALVFLFVKYLPTKHRGLTHTLPFALLFSAAVVVVYAGAKPSFAVADAASWFLIALSGYAMHLLADSVL